MTALIVFLLTLAFLFILIFYFTRKIKIDPILLEKIRIMDPEVYWQKKTVGKERILGKVNIAKVRVGSIAVPDSHSRANYWLELRARYIIDGISYNCAISPYARSRTNCLETAEHLAESINQSKNIDIYYDRDNPKDAFLIFNNKYSWAQAEIHK